MIFALYPLALEQGVDSEVFWTLSVKEIIDLLSARDRREKHDTKEDIFLAFLSARLIALNVADMLNGTNDAPAPWTMFPTLFEEEAKEADEAKAEEEKRKQDFYIDQLKARADKWNSRRK